MEIYEYKTVGDFYNSAGAEGYKIPVQMCHGLSQLMQAKDLTFQQAYEYLLKEGKIYLASKVYVYDLSANKLWIPNTKLADRQVNTDNIREHQQNLEWLARELKISIEEMYLVDDFYRQWKIQPDQKMTLETYLKQIQHDWANGNNTPQAIQDWEDKNNRQANIQ